MPPPALYPATTPELIESFTYLNSHLSNRYTLVECRTLQAMVACFASRIHWMEKLPHSVNDLAADFDNACDVALDFFEEYSRLIWGDRDRRNDAEVKEALKRFVLVVLRSHADLEVEDEMRLVERLMRNGRLPARWVRERRSGPELDVARHRPMFEDGDDRNDREMQELTRAIGADLCNSWEVDHLCDTGEEAQSEIQCQLPHPVEADGDDEICLRSFANADELQKHQDALICRLLKSSKVRKASGVWNVVTSFRGYRVLSSQYNWKSPVQCP